MQPYIYATVTTKDGIKYTTIASVISETRSAQRMSLREFGTELGVSHNAIAQYEQGIAQPKDEHLTAWLQDSRDWVWRMALEIYQIKNAALIAAAQARESESSKVV